MKDRVVRNLILETLEHVRERLDVDAYIEDVILQRFHPWMATFIEYGNKARGCGFCSSIPRGMYGGLRDELMRKAFDELRRGENAFRVVESLSRKECEDLEEQVLMNSVAISTLNALSYKLMSERVLVEDGFKVEEYPVGGYLFGHRIGSALRRVVKESDKVTVVGYAYWAFPYIAGRVKEFRCLELMDEEVFKVSTLSGMKPRVKVLRDPENSLLDADVVAITGMTIPNETLPDILKYSSSARLRILYGPSCSFHPERLFKLGVDALFAMKVPVSDEVKQNIIDSRGLSAYEDSRTKLVEIWAKDEFT